MGPAMTADADRALRHSGAKWERRVVFDGPPDHDAPRFVEVEDASGASVNAGEWRQRSDGLWDLVILAPACECDAERLRAALSQIALIAEWQTSGPITAPRCKSDALTAKQATSLRGSISEIARNALARSKP
jgi:hypothetical protein